MGRWALVDATGATIALQNTTDLNADGVVNGRQVGTGNTNHLVVSPRPSDGSFTTDGARKRFYVVVTGDSSDRG